jgi:hypothetical protein
MPMRADAEVLVADEGVADPGPSELVPFLTAQVGALESYDFVVAAATGPPSAGVEVRRDDDGTLQVEVVPREGAPLSPAEGEALTGLGYHHADARPRLAPAPVSPEAAAVAVDRTLRIAFGVGPERRIDLRNGSRRAAHDAEVRLAALRRRIEPLLTDLLGAAPERDGDGDYVFMFDSAQVIVAPRAVPDGSTVVRVFAITNVGVEITPDLGLFLAHLNFGLMFGRFGLDTEHRAVWFDETYLADQVTDDGLRFLVRMVAATADEWDDRIKALFGGRTGADLVGTPRPAGEDVTPKPEARLGGYL